MIANIKYRVSRMCVEARHDGKTVPTKEELYQLISKLENKKCPVCAKRMVWRGTLRKKSNVVTLQHNRDGTFGLLCFSCNARHQHYPGDVYLRVKKDEKYCTDCKQIKPLTEFTRLEARAWKKVRSYCRGCDSKRNKKWRVENKEYWATYMRKYRIKQKEIL